MSDRTHKDRGQLWLVRRIDRNDWQPFSGSLIEVVAYINRLHRETGMQHAAREIEQ